MSEVIKNKIQFKRGSGAPQSALDVGEPGYDHTNKKLYIGDGTSNIEVIMRSDLKNHGNSSSPVYFDENGEAQSITHTIAADVPSDAVFTDTTYGAGTYIELSNEKNFSVNLLALTNIIYPVGSIYMSANNVNPGTFLGGTWEAWGAGKVPVGVDASDTDFATAEKTGGEKTHTLATAEMPAHTHGSKTLTGTISYRDFNNGDHNPVIEATGIASSATYSWSGTHDKFGCASSQSNNTPTKVTINATHTHTSVGSGSAHNNLQPYITCYMWKRKA